MKDAGTTEYPCRALWIQVVAQAKEDLEGQPVSSLLYDQAAAFFVGGGHWAESRAVIADLLEMHADNLFHCGQRWIAARRSREGLPTGSNPEPQAPPALSPRQETGSDHDRWTTFQQPARASIAGTPEPAGQSGLDPIDAPSDAERRNPQRHRWYDIPGAADLFASRPLIDPS